MVVAILGIQGCSDGLPRRVPVSGKVVIDGQPVTFGSVRFVPKDGGRSASGQIEKDGTFTLSCYSKSDGCVPGTHQVAVYSVEELNERTARYYVPKKYSTASSSGLSFTITEPTESLNIDLTWGGLKGPVLEKLD
jgi:hypothetical protein